MKKLSKTALHTQAKKYNHLKDKRGVYGQLVSKFGKTQANKILRASKQLDKKPSSRTKSKTSKKTSKTIVLRPEWIMHLVKEKNKKHKDLKKTQVWCPITRSWESRLLAPEYAPAVCFETFPVVVEIAGKRWKVDVDPHVIGPMTSDEEAVYGDDVENYGHPLRMVSFTLTNKPLSIPVPEKTGKYVVKMFGQENSIQHSRNLFPVKNGKIIPHLMTIESDWGDSGNEVYFLELDRNKNPKKLYIESSCF